MLPIPQSERRGVSEAMRAIDATSPDAAVREIDLPQDVREGLDRYVFDGLVREAAPGTFYLYQAVPPQPTSMQFAKLILFWLSSCSSPCSSSSSRAD